MLTSYATSATHQNDASHARSQFNNADVSVARRKCLRKLRTQSGGGIRSWALWPQIILLSWRRLRLTSFLIDALVIVHVPATQHVRMQTYGHAVHMICMRTHAFELGSQHISRAVLGKAERFYADLKISAHIDTMNEASGWQTVCDDNISTKPKRSARLTLWPRRVVGGVRSIIMRIIWCLSTRNRTAEWFR